MIPSRAEFLRRRRCRFLILGMILGALLPVFERSWIALGVGLGGIAVLLVVYLRECRGGRRGDTAQSDTPPPSPAA